MIHPAFEVLRTVKSVQEPGANQEARTTPTQASDLLRRFTALPTDLTGSRILSDLVPTGMI